jgi:hypothetical protein
MPRSKGFAWFQNTPELDELEEKLFSLSLLVLEESMLELLDVESLVGLLEDERDAELRELKEYPSLDELELESIELELEKELSLTDVEEFPFDELELESIELDEFDELELNSLQERDKVLGKLSKVPSQTTVPLNPLLFCSMSVMVPAPVLCPTAVRFISPSS